MHVASGAMRDRGGLATMATVGGRPRHTIRDMTSPQPRIIKEYLPHKLAEIPGYAGSQKAREPNCRTLCTP